MEWITDKLWPILAAIVSAISGYLMFEKRKLDNRLRKLEEDSNMSKIEIAIIRTQYADLKEDTQEIKQLLKEVLKR